MDVSDRIAVLRPKSLVLVVCFAALIGAGAAAAATRATGHWVVVRATTLTNDYPVVLITSNVLHPRAVAVRLIGPKNEDLTASWNAYCTRGVATQARKGTLAGRGIVTKVLPLPFGHPDTCTVGGGVRLSRTPTVGGNRPIVRLQIQVLELR